MDTISFLTTIHEPMPEGTYLLIWTDNGKRSAWFPWSQEGTACLDAGCYISEIDGNVYFGCGLSPKNFGPKGRCPKDKIAAISGLWLDLDIGNDGHKGKTYPPTMAEAQKVIGAMPVAPTMVVHTGNGLHVYWLFKNHWVFGEDLERQRAAALVEAWQKLARAHAKRLGGWDIDATHDLARVLRVAGTKNVKDRRNPKPVTILEYTEDRRYDPEELEKLARDHMPQKAAPLLATDRPTVAPKKAPAVEPELAIDAVEVMRRVTEMIANEPKLRPAWDNKRGSCCDRSANILSFVAQVVCACPDISDSFLSEVMALFYEIHGDTPEKRRKGRRADFVADTIAKARDTTSRIYQTKEAATIVNDYAEQSRCEVMRKGGESVTAIAKDNAPQLCAALSKQFGFQVHGVRRYLGEPVTFELVTNCGAVDLGPPEAFASQTRFRARVMGITGRVIPALPRKGWENVQQVMLDIAEDVRLAEEATSCGMLRSIIRDYVAGATHDAEGAMEADNPWCGGNANSPFRLDGVTYLRLAGLREHIRMHKFEISDRDIPKLLTQAGCVAAKPHVVGDDGRRTTRSAYRVPDDLARQG